MAKWGKQTRKQELVTKAIQAVPIVNHSPKQNTNTTMMTAGLYSDHEHRGDHQEEDYPHSGMLELNTLSSANATTAPPKLYLVMPPEWLDPTRPLPTDQEFHHWISAQRRRHRRGLPPTGGSSNGSRSILSRSSSNASLDSTGSTGWQRIVETSTDFLQRARSGIRRRNSRDSSNSPLELTGMLGKGTLGEEGVELLNFE